jgi:hypothetical protein
MCAGGGLAHQILVGFFFQGAPKNNMSQKKGLEKKMAE